MVETFKKSIVIIGRSHGIIVPAYLIKQGKLQHGKTYQVTITELEVTA